MFNLLSLGYVLLVLLAVVGGIGFLLFLNRTKRPRPNRRMTPDELALRRQMAKIT